MVIARALLDRIVAHARRDFPNECCGIIATDDGRAVAVHEAQNLAASPSRACDRSTTGSSRRSST